MSRPKNYWNPIVKKMIYQYPNFNNEKSLQAGIFSNAIEVSLDDTKKLPYGELRIKAIDEVYFKKLKTCEGIAMEMNFSTRTVQGWLNSFVNSVGKNAGY